MKKSPLPLLDASLIETLTSVTPPITPEPEAALRIREQLFQRIHSPAPDYFFMHSHEGAWVRLRKGVELKLLRQDAESRSFLLHMAAGSRLPPHDHPLDEECLVMEGEATIHGVLCRPGDYHLAPQGKPHDWLTSENGCLLFVRSAVEQPAQRN